MLENLAEEESPLPVAEEKPQQADHFYDKFQAFLAKELIEQDGDTPFDEEHGDTFSDRFQAFLDQEQVGSQNVNESIKEARTLHHKPTEQKLEELDYEQHESKHLHRISLAEEQILDVVGH